MEMKREKYKMKLRERERERERESKRVKCGFTARCRHHATSENAADNVRYIL
jgi:hypothetical protein